MNGTDLAPEGTVWVCSACGKRARSRYGFDAEGKRTQIDPGWDEACMLKAVLCKSERRPDGAYELAVPLDLGCDEQANHTEGHRS